MGTSTDGIIGHGVVCEKGAEFPWEIYGEEEWWRKTSGYKPKHQPHTEEGDYAEGWSNGDPRFDEHFADERAWDKAHPMPVKVVNYCSDNCPMFALVVPSSHLVNNRGYPQGFDPEKLTVSDKELRALERFIVDHGIEGEAPRWLLMSYWG